MACHGQAPWGASEPPEVRVTGRDPQIPWILNHLLVSVQSLWSNRSHFWEFASRSSCHFGNQPSSSLFRAMAVISPISATFGTENWSVLPFSKGSLGPTSFFSAVNLFVPMILINTLASVPRRTLKVGILYWTGSASSFLPCHSRSKKRFPLDSIYAVVAPTVSCTDLYLNWYTTTLT